jgi:hypothetical protein
MGTAVATATMIIFGLLGGIGEVQRWGAFLELK